MREIKRLIHDLSITPNFSILWPIERKYEVFISSANFLFMNIINEHAIGEK